MKLNFPHFLLLIALFTVGCTSVTAVSQDSPLPTNEPIPIAETATAEPPSPTIEPATPLVATNAPPLISTELPLPRIILPIAVFIVDAEDEQMASDRTVEELTAVYERVNDIWAQADIRLDVQTIESVILPESITRSILFGDFNPFFANVGQTFDVPNASLINAFYSKEIGGPNGIVPFRSRVFFVMDTPSVHDERVSAHEVGHILGLHHVLDDPDRLMFSGTNGMMLSDEEIAVARYAAQGLLDGVR
ncbi:MAG: matrixin family metalloprotease [Chloroflexota bacterium]